jgi:hypothetical protein
MWEYDLVECNGDYRMVAKTSLSDNITSMCLLEACLDLVQLYHILF